MQFQGVDRAVARSVSARFGHPQILINSAGSNIRKSLVDFSLDEFRSVLDSSLISTFLVCRAFVPGMMRSGYGRKTGSLWRTAARPGP